LEKSGHEHRLGFQINGGLHCSSKDAPFDTESFPILNYCHSYKSNSPSSTRTRVAAVAYLDRQNEFSRHSIEHHKTIHKRYLNALQKIAKQQKFLKEVKISNVALSNHVQCLSWEYIKNTVAI
jgi:hypothetical protein